MPPRRPDAHTLAQRHAVKVQAIRDMLRREAAAAADGWSAQAIERVRREDEQLGVRRTMT